jgi:glycolate oxidase iron-sulfur subunit
MAKLNPEETKRFISDLGTCIECGNCTFWCPIYHEEADESSVARGKIKMIKRLLSGETDYTPEFTELLSKCMLCKTCAEHCPVACQVQSTVLASRADRVKAQGVGPISALIYRGLIPRRRLFGNIVRIASWFQGIVAPKTEGRIRHLPMFLSALGKGRKIPSIAPKFLRQMVPAVNRPSGKPKMRVGYFVGCAMDFIFPDIARGTIDFLVGHGVEVVVPRAQGCCGAPVWVGAGDFETGRRLADANVRAFEDVDRIVVDCATCLGSLKEYAKYLADSPAREAAYRTFEEKIVHTSLFLTDELKIDPASLKPSDGVRGKRITWHDPCHLNRYAKIKNEPRQILKSIPETEYVEMVRADRCCGMAGSFSVHYYDLSKKIADKKAETIRETEADIVATACPGCMIQLMDTLKRNNLPQKVMYLTELFK